MELDDALRWTLRYRAMAFGAFLAGLLVAVVGVAIGFGSGIANLLADPLNPAGALEGTNPTLILVFLVLGVLVWQIGKTYAFFATVPRAAAETNAERFDHERLKSEVLEALDERLAAMEEDVAETRRSVGELKRAEYASQFDESEMLDDESEMLEERGLRESGDSSPPTSDSSPSTGDPSPSTDDPLS